MATVGVILRKRKFRRSPTRCVASWSSDSGTDVPPATTSIGSPLTAGRTVAKRAVEVTPPAVRCSTGGDAAYVAGAEAGMVAAGGDTRERPPASDRNRRQSGSRRTVPKLTACVESPAVGIAARRQRTCVDRAGGKPCEGHATDDRRWNDAIDHCTVAELTGEVPTPAVRNACRTKTARVIGRGRHVLELQATATRTDQASVHRARSRCSPSECCCWRAGTDSLYSSSFRLRGRPSARVPRLSSASAKTWGSPWGPCS